MTIRNLLVAVLCLSFIIHLVPASCEADIVYQLIPQTVGPHTATGTITTDGTIGPLTTANVIGHNTFVDAGGPGVPMVNLYDFSGVTASATELSWDGGFGLDEVYFGDAGPNIDLWGFIFGDTLRVRVGGTELTSMLGLPHTFATVTEQSPVPEPSSIALAALGLLSLGLIGRRRRRR